MKNRTDAMQESRVFDIINVVRYLVLCAHILFIVEGIAPFMLKSLAWFSRCSFLIIRTL